MTRLENMTIDELQSQIESLAERLAAVEKRLQPEPAAPATTGETEYDADTCERLAREIERRAGEVTGNSHENYERRGRLNAAAMIRELAGQPPLAEPDDLNGHSCRSCGQEAVGYDAGWWLCARCYHGTPCAPSAEPAATQIDTAKARADAGLMARMAEAMRVHIRSNPCRECEVSVAEYYAREVKS